MNTLHLSNINTNFVDEMINKLGLLSPIDRLDTIIILPNYSLLSEMRERLLDIYGVVGIDSVLTIDDIVDNLSGDAHYIDNNIQHYIIKSLIEEDTDLHINNVEEVQELINEFKSYRLSSSKLLDMSCDPNLKAVINLYKKYENLLDTINIKDQTDKYISSIENCSDITGKNILIGGFIEFRHQEMELIQCLSKSNSVDIYYPFVTERENIKTANIIESLDGIGYRISTDININNDIDRLTYYYLSDKDSKYKVDTDIITGNSTYNLIKRVLSDIKNLTKKVKPEDISIVIPDDYEYLVKEIAKTVDINIVNLTERSILDLDLVRGLYDLVDYILDEDKEKLITVITGLKSVLNLDTVPIVDELRTLDYKNIDSLKGDLSPELSSTLDHIDNITKSILKDPIEGIYTYIELFKPAEDTVAPQIDNIKEYKQSSELLSDILDEIYDLLILYPLKSRDQLELIIESLATKTYYDDDNSTGVKLLKDINSIGVHTDYRYVLGLEKNISLTGKSHFKQSTYDEYFKSIGISQQTSEEDIDNQIIKFLQSAASCEKLSLCWVRSEDLDYPILVEKLIEDIDEGHINVIKDSSISYQSLLWDQSEDNISRYLELEDIKSLNDNIGRSYLKQVMDPNFWGKIDQNIKYKSYSASMLDTYNQCGFKFMMKYIYEFEKYQIDYVDEFYLNKGNLYHYVLMEFYKNNHHYINLSEEEVVEKVTELVGVYTEDKEINNVYKTYVVQKLVDFIIANIEDQENLLIPFIPYSFENRYYRDLGGATIYGTIDRIDKSSVDEYLIYDYKSSSAPSNRSVLNLESLQLPIYSYLIDNTVGVYFGVIEGPKSTPTYILKDRYKKKRTGTHLDPEELQEYNASIKERLKDLLDNIESGNFLVDPVDNVCRYCDYKTICREEERVEI